MKNTTIKEIKYMKLRILSRILIVFAMIVALGMILYPDLSELVNSYSQSKMISAYSEAAEDQSDLQKTLQLENAVDFNNELFAGGSSIGTYSASLQKKYEYLLDINGTGVIGSIDVPKVNIHLPIYHGTSDSALGAGVGHLEGTSLPVGGENSHAVLSGHTGMPSARLFTGIDQLEIGDTFTIRVLDDVLSYEVDEINTVLPKEIEFLKVQEGKDLVTLMTCTPYGINSHRLLIRGHRIPTINLPAKSDFAQMLAEVSIHPLYLVLGVTASLIFFMIFVFLILERRKKQQNWSRSRSNKLGEITKINRISSGDTGLPEVPEAIKINQYLPKLPKGQEVKL